MDINVASSGFFAVAALAGGFFVLDRFGPGYAAGALHSAIERVRASAWLRDQAKPKRLAWFKATLELLEDELPEAGTQPEFYDPIGAEIADHLKVGTAAQWSKAARAFGDAFDTELDGDLAAISAAAAQPPPAEPPAA